MTHRRRILVATCLATLPALAACFSASSAGPGGQATFDAGGSDSPVDSTMPDEAGQDAANDSGPEATREASAEASPSPEGSAEAATDSGADAALDAAIPDGACNAISLVGVPGGTLVSSTATLPAATGGVISDGTYYATLATLYEQDAGGVITGGLSGVWVITGGGTHLETDLSGALGGASVSYTLFPLDAGSTSVGVTVTCANGMAVSNSGEWPYSVTTIDGGLQLSVIPNSQPLLWVTYTKQ